MNIDIEAEKMNKHYNFNVLYQKRVKKEKKRRIWLKIRRFFHVQCRYVGYVGTLIISRSDYTSELLLSEPDVFFQPMIAKN